MRFGGLGAGSTIAVLALAIPALVFAADVTVNAIPGAGWTQAPDNSAGLAAVIVDSPEVGLGDSSVELTTATAASDFVGIGRAIASPLSDITAGSWMTYVTGDSGLLVAEPASLRFGMYRLGGLSEFTTLSVERVYSATVTADVWQTTTLDDATMVYQTNIDDGFCLVASPCTFADFKTNYPAATVLGLQVAIGTGIPVTTSYVDGVSLTIDGVTDTWDFELAAPAPTATPTAGASAVVTPPPTDIAVSTTPPAGPDGRGVITFGVLTLVSLSTLVLVRVRRSRQTR